MRTIVFSIFFIFLCFDCAHAAPNGAGGEIFNANVGIGTSNPQGMLAIVGNMGIGTWTVAGGNLIVNGGGNVGINSAWPGALLDVNGTERMTGFDLTKGAATGDVLVTNSIGVGTWMASSTLAGGSPGGSNAQLEYNNGGSFGGVTESTVNSNGNLGLGTTVPHDVLSIVGNIGIGTASSSSFVTTTVPNGVMIVEKNIGIGTTVPGAALDVNGTIYISGVNAIGYPRSDTTPGGSIAVGMQALAKQNAAGSAAYGNTAVGYQAMGIGTMTTAAIGNTALGYKTLGNLTSGSANTAVGSTYNAYDLTSGSNNTFIGTGEDVTTGNNVTAIGNDALQSFTGSNSTAVSGAGNVITGNNITVLAGGGSVGDQSVALSSYSGTGANVTVIGHDTATSGTPSGNNVTAVGSYTTATALTSGADDLIIGTDVDSTTLATGYNDILIGTSSVTDTNASNTNNNLNIGALLQGDMTNSSSIYNTTLFLQGTANSVDYLQVAGAATGNPGKVVVSTQGSDTNVSIELLPNGTGNVGVGTLSFSPQSMLDVEGGMAIGSYAGAKAAPSNGFIISGNVGIGTWTVAGGNLIVNGGGNVGINSSWPGMALDVNGTNRMRGFTMTGSPVSGYIMLSNSSAGNGAWSKVSSPGGTTPQLQYDNNGSFAGIAGSGADPNGNIGLGTTGPLNTFAIVGSVGIGTTASSSFVATTAPNGGLIVEKNIGIGTKAPSAALDVNGAINIKGVNGISFPTDYPADQTIAIGSSSLWSQNGAGPAEYGGEYANTAIGYQTLGIGTTITQADTFQVTIGYQAGANPDVSAYPAVGYQAFDTSNSSSYAPAIGFQTLYLGEGINGFVIGSKSLISGDSTGTSNLGYDTQADYYTSAFGSRATSNPSTYAGSTFGAYASVSGGVDADGSIGAFSTDNASYTGDLNIVIGENAGSTLTSGNTSTIIGYNVASTTQATGDFNILIGTSSAVDTLAGNTSTYLNIGNILQGSTSHSTATHNITLYLQSTANGVDYVQIAGSAAGSPGVVTVSGQGSDSNVAMELLTKGTGKVGVGTTLPLSAMDVKGNMAVGSYAGNNAAPANGLIVSGNVGIGSMVPGQGLDVNGNIRIRGTNAHYFGDDNSVSMVASAATAGDLKFLTNNKEIMRITNSGNVGIGTTTPRAAFVVTNGNVGIGTWLPGAALVVQGNVGIGTNTANYNLEIGGCTSITGSTSCVDLAELIPSSQEAAPADVMMLDGSSSATVMKATKQNNNMLFGVVTTDPAIVIEGSSVGIINGEGFKADPMKPAVALAGRVPVKTNLENGPIQVGDMIGNSSVPGVGARAVNPGRVIGIALEPLTDLGHKAYKDILVYVNPHWWPGKPQGRWTKIEDPQDLFDKALLCADGEIINVCSKKADAMALGAYEGLDGDGHVKLLTGGLGRLMLANKGEDLGIGDYLMSSQTQGLAEKQPLANFMNYTVAKLMENVNWKPGEKSRRVLVVYKED